jgi:hypothetical protein
MYNTINSMREICAEMVTCISTDLLIFLTSHEQEEYLNPIDTQEIKAIQTEINNSRTVEQVYNLTLKVGNELLEKEYLDLPREVIEKINTSKKFIAEWYKKIEMLNNLERETGKVAV